MTERVDINGLYDLMVAFFGRRLRGAYFGSKDLTAGGVLYESFELECGLDERYGSFGAAIRIGLRLATSEFFGAQIMRDPKPDVIRTDFALIDRWCRARLTQEFLAEYDANLSSGGHLSGSAERLAVMSSARRPRRERR